MNHATSSAHASPLILLPLWIIFNIYAFGVTNLKFGVWSHREFNLCIYKLTKIGFFQREAELAEVKTRKRIRWQRPLFLAAVN